MHDSSGKVCIKHAKFGSHYKATTSFISVTNFIWNHEIWQLLHSYLTIKSDKKKSPQQQAHELYPFLPSCSLSLSQLKFWALFPSTSLIGQQVCQLSSSDWLLLSSRQLELDVWQSLHQAVEKQHHRVCVCICVRVCAYQWGHLERSVPSKRSLRNHQQSKNTHTEAKLSYISL